MQCGITRSDITDVALEMLHIDWIEANNGGIEANVCFRNIGPKVIWTSMLSEMSFGTVKGIEQGADGLLVSFLRSSDGQLVA